MDKNALKDFAMKSRESLTRTMRAKLESLHITEELTFKQHGDIWENEQHLLPAMTNSDHDRYNKLYSVVKRDGLKSVIERAAYTWFNRIVAIRYMEVNDFLPLGKNFESLGINVLCDKSGDFRNPEIMTMSKLRSTDLDIDYAKINTLTDKDKYKEIMLAVIKKLGEAIPDVFDGDTENIDALIPDNLLLPNGLIDNILKLGEEQFKHTEIIGWLYQYYNQAEKDRAMNLKTSTVKEDIPFVTQIFTPDWVVKYLVENSLGRFWLDRHPNEELGKKWKYLVKRKEKPEVIKDDRKITDITFIDPCSGSGHILIYAFEVFYQIYMSEGYPKSDIPSLILNNNLYGLDIDDRANQLSILACMLVARKYDDKLFTKKIERHILSVRETNKINLSTFAPKGEAGDVLKYLMDTFQDAKEYGSILKVRSLNYNALREAINSDEFAKTFRVDQELEPIISQAEILSDKFTITITNPPYMGFDKYNPKLSTYLKDNYRNTWKNLAVVFAEKISDMTETRGVYGMIAIDGWTFLPSFTNFRDDLLNNNTIMSLLFLGNGVFRDVTVSTAAFLIENRQSEKYGKYYSLENGASEEKNNTFIQYLHDDIEGLSYYSHKSSDFNNLPEKAIMYSAPSYIINIFNHFNRLDDDDSSIKATPIQGLVTCNVNRFLREWWEVDYCKVNTKQKRTEEIVGKWFPCNKGGQFRRWYGNDGYVVNYENNGAELKETIAHNFPPKPFDEMVTWSKISGGLPSFRYKDNGSISDDGGPAMFGDHDSLIYISGVLNSKLADIIIKYLSPSMNTKVGELASFPLARGNNTEITEVNNIVMDCIKISKSDWDDSETSWDFTRHPLLKSNNTLLVDAFKDYSQYCDDRFSALKRDEELLNQIIIGLYGLNDELTPEVSDDRITVRKADHEREAKSFLSYFIGCLMGRYDPDTDGIQYAGDGTELPKNRLVDDDGIITLLEKEFPGKDDVINKLRHFLSVVFDEKTVSENLDWIADGLGRKDAQRSEDVIRDYFVNDFFNNHAHMIYADPTKRSDGRPIYWQISSGKHNAFKALFYIHRYTPGLIAKVRMDYSTPVLRGYERRKAEIEAQLKTTVASGEYSRLNNELSDIKDKIEELTEFDRILKNVADQKIELDLDDGVKANYPKLSLAASEVKKNAQILEAIK